MATGEYVPQYLLTHGEVPCFRLRSDLTSRYVRYRSFWNLLASPHLWLDTLSCTARNCYLSIWPETHTNRKEDSSVVTISGALLPNKGEDKIVRARDTRGRHLLFIVFFRDVLPILYDAQDDDVQPRSIPRFARTRRQSTRSPSRAIPSHVNSTRSTSGVRRCDSTERSKTGRSP